MARPKAVKDLSDPRLVKAMTHPLRVRILNTLRDEQMSPKELSTRLESPIGNVSYHVRTLVDLGLLKLMVKKQRRGAVEHFYRAVPAPVAASAWEGVPGTVRDAMTASTLSRVGELAANAASGGGFERPESTLATRTLALDEAGWKELADATAEFERRVDALKQAKNGDGVDAAIVTLVFEPRSAKPVPQARRGRPPKAA